VGFAQAWGLDKIWGRTGDSRFLGSARNDNKKSKSNGKSKSKSKSKSLNAKDAEFAKVAKENVQLL
jgi:hypothetical protein